MNKLVPIGIGAAAVVVAVVGGTQLLRPPAPAGVGAIPAITAAPTPSPSPTPTPSPTPSPTPEGLLPEGSHLLWDESGVRMTVTIPGPGWYGERAGGILVSEDDVKAPDGAGMIVFAGFDDLLVYGDPCRWATTTPKKAATTVDAFVAALAAQASRDASAPVDVTLDGHPGKAITLHVPDDAVFAKCDEGKFASWGNKEGTLRHQQDAGQINKVWVGEVDGGLAIIDQGYYEGTPRAVIDEQDAIVKSVVFE